MGPPWELRRRIGDTAVVVGTHEPCEVGSDPPAGQRPSPRLAPTRGLSTRCRPAADRGTRWLRPPNEKLHRLPNMVVSMGMMIIEIRKELPVWYCGYWPVTDLMAWG